MAKYIGITLGPIHNVLSYAKTTRAIWASSYLFSYLAKQIVTSLYALSKEKKVRFLKPRMQSLMFETRDGVGRFPDQYIVELSVDVQNEVSLEGLRTEWEEILILLAQDICKAVGKSDDELVRIGAYLKHALRLVLIEKEMSDLTDGQIVYNMQQMMSMLECQDEYCAEEECNYLALYFESTSTDTLLMRDRNEHCRRPFNTILEYSVGFEYKGDKKLLLKESDNVIAELRTRQKYIALVSADGDNFGSTLAQYGEEVGDIFDAFSRNLPQMVEEFGGKMIYQGGDDMFFFAPLYCPEGNQKGDLFGLLSRMGSCFDEMIKEWPRFESIEPSSLRPSLSFGVSVSYYKYPMFETKFMSENLLEEAKKTENKNKINWKVRKHSGQTFGAMIDKNDPEELNKSVDLINASLGRDSLFLHSVTYWLDSQLEMLSYILENEDADFRQQALQNFMNNNFNEGIHGNYESFLLRAQEYLLHFEKGSGLRKLHVLLRYITLLIKKNDYE